MVLKVSSVELRKPSLVKRNTMRRNTTKKLVTRERKEENTTRPRDTTPETAERKEDTIKPKDTTLFPGTTDWIKMIYITKSLVFLSFILLRNHYII